MRDTGKASDFFEDLEELQTLLWDAEREAKTESAQQFAADMEDRVSKFGLDTYLSERQLSWLCELADWDIPARRIDR